MTGMDRALPMNTGAEAVETAIKAARKWAYKVKRVPDGQAQIIVAAGNFAGRTTTIVSFSSEPQYRDGFGPFAPGFRSVPFGDAGGARSGDHAAHRRRSSSSRCRARPASSCRRSATCARCARSARAHDVLMIADEVQTGLGRTGRMLACDHEGVRPDGLTLGKALGGGLLPVSALLRPRRRDGACSRPATTAAPSAATRSAAAVGDAALTLLESGPYLRRPRGAPGRVPARRNCAEARPSGDRRHARQGPASSASRSTRRSPAPATSAMRWSTKAC